MANETGSKIEQPIAEPKETELKRDVKYENRFLDEEQWHPYIREWLEYVKIGGIYQDRKKILISFLEKSKTNFNRKKVEEKIESKFKDYLNEQENIAQKIAIILEKFLSNELEKKELERNIPEYFVYELNGNSQPQPTKYKSEKLAEREHNNSVNMWIQHFLGNYIHDQNMRKYLHE